MDTIGPRPSDPSKITFAPDAFRKVGERVEYIVASPIGYGYPSTFDCRSRADAYARKTGRVVTERTLNVYARVRWTD